jgi:hypothetical protein
MAYLPILVPAIVCLVGLLLYTLTDATVRPKISVIGLKMFWVGLFVFLLKYSGTMR